MLYWKFQSLVLAFLLVSGFEHGSCVVEGPAKMVQMVNKDLIASLVRISQDHRDATNRPNASAACQEDFEYFVKNLIDGNLWAIKMVDASTKIPESLLTGHLTHLGNFDECLDVVVVKQESPFKGQHCLAGINFAGDAGSSSVQLPGPRMAGLVGGRGSVMPPGLPAVKMSFCLPSTCTPEDVAITIENLFHYLVNMTVSVDVTERSCHTRKAVELDTKDWVVVGIVTAFLLLAVASTSYDLLKSGPKTPLFLAFSWYTNGKKLLSTSSSTDMLHSLHGIRFLSMCWVVLGHRYLANLTGPVINMYDILDLFHPWYRVYLTNAVLSVDTFFLLSGLLVSYVFLKEMSKANAKFNIFAFYLHRYLRLTPALAVIVMFNATLLNKIGNGPLWDTFTNLARKECNERWWSDILYIGNYLGHMCVAQGWYLAVDMQLFWASPLILIPLLKFPRLGRPFLGLLILGGLGSAFAVAYINEYGAGNTILNPTLMESQVNQYVVTHARLTPWLLGIALGYYLHKLQGRKLVISKPVLLLGWLLGIGALLGSLFGLVPFQQPEYVYERVSSSFYIALHRSLWATGVGWIIFVCVKGYGGPVNTFLSWKVFQPLSRLCYCMYLVHMAEMGYRIYATKVPYLFTDLDTVSEFVYDVVLTAAIAAPMSLLFESPIIIIEKIIFGRGGKQSKSNAPCAPPEEQGYVGHQADVVNSLESYVGHQADAVNSVESDIGHRADVVNSLESYVGHQADVVNSVESDIGHQADVVNSLESDIGHRADAVNSVESDIGHRADAVNSLERRQETDDFEVTEPQETVLRIETEWRSVG